MFCTRRRLWSVLPLLLLIFFLCSLCRADRVFLHNGRSVEGVVDETRPGVVRIETSSGVVSFPANNVLRVEKSSTRSNARAKSELALGKGKLRSALSSIESAHRDLESRLKAIADFLLSHGDSIVKGAASMSASDMTAFENSILDRSTSASAELYVVLGRVRAERSDWTGFVEELLQVSPTYWQRNPSQAKTVQTLVEQSIKEFLAVGRNELALKAVRLLSNVVPTRENQSGRIQFELGEAERLASIGRFDEALRLLADSLAPLAPGIALESTRRILRDAATVIPSSALAPIADSVALSFLETSAPVSGRVKLQQEAIEILLSAEQYDLARRAADRLSLLQSDAGALELHRVEFARRRAAITDSDLLARYQLGVWGVEMGLHKEPLAEFQAARISPTLKENAELQIELLQSSEQKSELQEIAALYQNGQYPEVIRRAENFRKQTTKGPYHTEAGSLLELSRYAIKRGQEMKGDRGVALIQNAERLVLQGRNAEALPILTQIQVDYAGSAISKRASELRRKAEMAMNPKNSSVTSPPPAMEPEDRQQQQEIRSLVEKLTGKTL